jgi:DNA polymerase III epsilon subunit family exonuclease
MNCDFVVFDLETTGLSSRFDEIIQIAAARFGPGGTVTDEVFATFVRPEASISSFITGLTGISNRDVADAPPVADALAAFSDFVGDAVLIAHNGHRFDAKFLTAACEQKRLTSRPVALIDSIAFSKRLFGTTRGTSHGLDAALTRTHVTTFQGRRHDARGDVSALAQAVERMWRQLKLDATCSGIPRAGTHLPKPNR